MRGIKVLGHSVHPILIVFPLGLLATAVVFDLIHLFKGTPVFAVVAYWMIVAGLIGGALAAVFGWLDWLTILKGSRAKSIGLAHGLVNSVVMLLFLVSWYLRYADPSRPEMLATVLSTVGAGVAVVGGWLGGELVERLGVSVHYGAEPDAPSSLSVSRPDIQTERR